MTSIIKVNNLQNQCGANIINENAGTITIGASGDTVTLAAGASQSGFGRSGSVNWDTTPKTTSPVTAVSGNGYFIDTTSGAITINLPATPSAGDIVAIADYNGTALTNNITVGRNSSDINGSAADLTINNNYSAVTLVYVDATSGWRSVDTSNPNDIFTAPEYVAAIGGTVTCCGDYKIHTFTGPGTFTVTSAGNPLGSDTVDYLVIGGGGGAGSRQHAGGGGAGGFRESVPSPAAWTASPLANPGGAIPVSATGYPITVGSGGAGGVSGCNNNGSDGNNSIFSTITAALGGRGGTYNFTGNPGGSGGGGGGNGSPASPGGTGNTPPVNPSQGNNGGNGQAPAGGGGGGGGGGAGAVGSNFVSPGGGGNGGAGVSTSISGSSIGYAGGSGGGGCTSGGTVPSPAWGSKSSSTVPGVAGENARANSGSGGGTVTHDSVPTAGGAGGSGIVIIRYKYQ
jgi:hypothetical protein